MKNQTAAKVVPIRQKAKGDKCTRPKRDIKCRGKHKKLDATLQIPVFVVQSEEFRMLSAFGLKLLVEFLHRHNGSNNGDLSMPFSSVKDWGFGSKSTLRKALAELEAGGFIFKTRQGRGGSGGATPSLYAITWRPICNIRGKDYIKAGPARRPRRAWTTAVPYREMH